MLAEKTKSVSAFVDPPINQVVLAAEGTTVFQLSIVIPIDDDHRALDATLVSVLENRPANCEILLACDLSYEDPYDLDGEVRFVRTQQSGDWVHRANLALMESRGQVIHLLMPGCEVHAGWTDEALDLLANDPMLASVAPVLTSADGIRATLGVTYRMGGIRQTRTMRRERIREVVQHLILLGPTATAGFYRRENLMEVDGWDERLGPDLADVDLGLALAADGFDCQVAASSHVTFGVHQRRRGFGYGMRSERLFWRHLRSQGLVAGLVSHLPAIVVTSLENPPTSLTELPGRVVGLLTPAMGRQPLSLRSRSEPTEFEYKRVA